MQFRYTCEGVDGPYLEELEHLIETAEVIEAAEFYELVGDDPILTRFEEKFGPISEDPMIHCYKGRLPDSQPACYFDYSRIEHVFY